MAGIIRETDRQSNQCREVPTQATVRYLYQQTANTIALQQEDVGNQNGTKAQGNKKVER